LATRPESKPADRGRGSRKEGPATAPFYCAAARDRLLRAISQVPRDALV
jgi:hypothetical protein